MSVYISTFNPLRMEEQEFLALATGREHLLKKVLIEMERCLKPQSNHHFLLHGPRGIGKSFFTKYLKIHCKRLPLFDNSLFVQLPEEQSNLQFVGDLIDMLCAAIQNQSFQNVQAKWEVDDTAWRSSVKKLKQLIKEQKANKPDFHLFFSMENLQDFIPQLDEIENGRLREFLEQFKDVSLIGTSVRPDLDNNYNKRLFHVFKKYTLKPWTLDDCLAYYDKRVAYLKEKGETLTDVALNSQKVKAISVFTGGSPRIAVILNRLVLEENIKSVADTLRGIIDELTPYYQDLTKAMPPKTKLLFDTLIRNGENMTQSKLAELLGKQQNVISKPFRWLKDNFYVRAVKQKQGNTYHYSVNDRMYSLYWQQREMLSEGQSIIALLAGFLFQFFGERELLEKTKEAIAEKSPIGKLLLKLYHEDNEFDIMSDKEREKYFIKREEDRLDDIDKFSVKIKEQKKVVSKTPTYGSYNDLGAKYLSYWLLKNEENILNKAIKSCEQSIEIRENESAYHNLAYAKLFSGDVDESIIYFKKSIDFNPRNIANLFGTGELMYSKDRFGLALKFYEAGLSYEPQNYGALIDVAHLHFILHNDNKGFEYLDKASKVDEEIKATYKNKTSHQDMFYHSAGKILDFSRNRTRPELFSVLMTIIDFFKKEEVGNWSYSYPLQTFLQRLYIFGEIDLMLDVISEVRGSIKKKTGMDDFLSSLEYVFSIPYVLDKLNMEHESFKKLPFGIPLFLQNLKYAKERFESGKKIY